MKEKRELSIWGDNWWIENGEAWFVWGMNDILCHFDMKSDKCELLTCIPDISQSKFRLTSFCMKYHNDIYCMPSYGKNIWIYDTVSCRFDEICVNDPHNALLNIQDFWEYEKNIYAVSNGLGQIIEIDPAAKKIVDYYRIYNEGSISKSVKAGASIYSLIGEFGSVYQFDLITKEISLYKLPDIGRKYNTLCFDGEKFWLSGFRKEIYVWDKNINKVITVDAFPKGFGIYDFSKEADGMENCTLDEYERCTFSDAAVVGENVWFIPFCTNKIIYVNKHTYQLHAFEIEEERETKESILERSSLAYKYLLDYVKDDRYIGIFSIKNKCILEIDTAELNYEYKRYGYHISDRCIKDYADLCNNIFDERNVWEREIYNCMIRQENNKMHCIASKSTGVGVYEKMACNI